MYLTRIALDTRRRDTMRAIAFPSKFHGALESAFPGDRPHNLWRLDSLNGKLYLLLLSDTEPELTSFCKQFSEYPDAWETRSYDGLLERLTVGSRWRFRLTANPTRSVGSGRQGVRGTVHAHITAEHQRQWLAERAEKHGFRLEGFDVVQSRWLRFYKKNGRPVTLLSVTYEGLLEVTDPALFRAAMTNGIGRGKAYGLGLLTVVRG